MTEYANQALNATTGEPQKVLIVFDNKMSRKASRYFEASERERENILSELNARGVVYFIGDDTQGDVGVFQAYQNALSTLEKSTLFDPCGGDEQVQSFIDAFPESVKKNVDENE
jgi:CRISPR-associated protein Cst2